MSAITLNIIRVALLMGVLSVGVVAYFLRSGAFPGSDQDAMSLYQQVFAVLFLGAVVGVFFVRKKRMQAKTIAAAGHLNITGWALGEVVAIFGFVVYLLFGTPTLYVIGVLFFLFTFFFFPIPDDTAA